VDINTFKDKSIELKAAASAYHDLGCAVVPFWLSETEKKPLIEWKKWISEPQTNEEFEALTWDNANGFGVVCGARLKNGLFVGVVDFDVKNLSQETIEKGRETLKKFRATQTEQTPSGGQHWIYHCREKPKTVSAFHNDYALELIGEGKPCVVAPSLGYKRLNDNAPSEVQDLTQMFYNVLGVKAETKTKSWFNREDLTAKPYKKENPPCIKEFLKGVSAGQRNDVAIRLSSYFVNFRQLEPKKAFKELVDWNCLNNPALSEAELRAVFESAIKGKYVFGCDDNILKIFCKENNSCSLRKKDKPTETEKKTYDAETEAQLNVELEKILACKNQIEALKLHLDRVLVGEQDCKTAIFVLLIGSKYPEPEFKQIILIKATEGSGKSTLIRNMAEGYKVKDVGRFSAHALDYTNLEGYEILSLKELGSMDEEKQGVSTIKFLSSDDRGYNVEITVRDEATGKFKTETYTIPCITVVSTTTRLILDSQFERRAWIFGMDESPQQTERVAKWKAQNEREKAEVLLGLRKITSLEFSQEVIKRFIAQIKPVKVVIPFPKTLSEVLGFDVLRVRGDIDKLYTFTKLYAALNVKRLQKLREDVYAVSPQVCIEALQIAEKPIEGMISRIDERAKAILSVLKEIKDVKLNEEGQEDSVINYDIEGSEIDKKIREQIAVKIGKSERTVRDFFNFLSNSGYVSSDQKKPKTYTLLYNVKDIEEKLSGILEKFKSADVLMEKMTKEALEWLKIGLEIQTPADSEKKFEHTARKGLEDSKIFMPSTGKTISNLDLHLKQTVLHERSSENRQNEKLPIPRGDNSEDWIVKREGAKVYAKDGNVMFQCLVCKEHNKTMFFATPYDLNQHMTLYHGFSDYVR